MVSMKMVNHSLIVQFRLNVINYFTELLELGMVRTVEDQALKDEGYKLHAYNILVSNRLGFNRSIPDTRHEL